MEARQVESVRLERKAELVGGCADSEQTEMKREEVAIERTQAASLALLAARVRAQRAGLGVAL